MRHAICYISRANHLDLSLVKILMKKTEISNNAHNIKGLLLYADGNFFHIMEGEKQYVRDLFARIEKDTRHNNLIQILGKDVPDQCWNRFKSQLLTENSKDNPELLTKCLQYFKYFKTENQQSVKRIIRSFFQTG